MDNKLKGKERWIYKFKMLSKQRRLIITAFFLWIFIILISLIVISNINYKLIIYLIPTLIITFSFIYPHLINKKRLENLYSDLPKELRGSYAILINNIASNNLKIMIFHSFTIKKKVNSFIDDLNKWDKKNKTD